MLKVFLPKNLFLVLSLNVKHTLVLNLIYFFLHLYSNLNCKVLAPLESFTSCRKGSQPKYCLIVKKYYYCTILNELPLEFLNKLFLTKIKKVTEVRLMSRLYCRSVLSPTKP